MGCGVFEGDRWGALFRLSPHLCLGLLVAPRASRPPREHEMPPSCSARGVKATGSARAPRPAQGRDQPPPLPSPAAFPQGGSKPCPATLPCKTNEPSVSSRSIMALRQTPAAKKAGGSPGRISPKGWDSGKGPVSNCSHSPFPSPSFHSSLGMHGYKWTCCQPAAQAGGARDARHIPAPPQGHRGHPRAPVALGSSTVAVPGEAARPLLLPPLWAPVPPGPEK